MSTRVSQQFVKDSIAKKPWQGPVIDLGSGIQAAGYKSFFGKAEYVCLDFKQPSPAGTNIIADIQNMPKVKSEAYGVVMLLETLEHIANPFLAFKEAARILKPNGLFICTTVACWTQHRHPRDYYRFLPDGLEYLCAYAGLKPYHVLLDAANTTSPCHTCIAAIKQK